MENKKDYKKMIVSAVFILLMIIFFIAVYGKWCDIWYRFGANLYKALNV